LRRQSRAHCSDITSAVTALTLKRSRQQSLLQPPLQLQSLRAQTTLNNKVTVRSLLRHCAGTAQTLRARCSDIIAHSLRSHRPSSSHLQSSLEKLGSPQQAADTAHPIISSSHCFCRGPSSQSLPLLSLQQSATAQKTPRTHCALTAQSSLQGSLTAVVTGHQKTLQ
jgi:hypothetical protein